MKKEVVVASYFKLIYRQAMWCEYERRATVWYLRREDADGVITRISSSYPDVRLANDSECRNPAGTDAQAVMLL